MEMTEQMITEGQGRRQSKEFDSEAIPWSNSFPGHLACLCMMTIQQKT